MRIGKPEWDALLARRTNPIDFHCVAELGDPTGSDAAILGDIPTILQRDANCIAGQREQDSTNRDGSATNGKHALMMSLAVILGKELLYHVRQGFDS